MISVIVTVYNKEPYIRRCIESIENNTYKDIELIIVEDCSTDNSMTIIQELMSEYNNIKLIKNETNQGAGYSRNVGIKAAKGEWISLIDADDWIDSNYYQTYIDRVDDGVDMIFSECNIIVNESVNYKNYSRYNKVYNDSEYCIKNFSELMFQFLNISLIKRHLFNNIEYCKSRFIEDTPTAYLLLYYSKKIQTIDYCGYNYFQEPNSLIHTNSNFIKTIYYCYNMIDVINHISMHNKELGNYIYNYIYKIFYKFSIMYAKDYDDVKKEFSDIDLLCKYFNISKEYMSEQKILSTSLSKCKVIHIK